MIFEIVTHCHKYSRPLIYQLSSLVLFPPSDILYYSLYNNPDDTGTARVVEFFRDKLPGNIVFQVFQQPLNLLLSRGIGREERARNTKADWVWFADADYTFRNKCWEDLAKAVRNIDADLVWPYNYMRTTYEKGKQLIGAVTEPQIIDVIGEGITKTSIAMAIGGIQIARGDYLRKNGYSGGGRPMNRWKFGSDTDFRVRVARRTSIDIDHTLRICTQPMDRSL